MVSEKLNRGIGGKVKRSKFWELLVLISLVGNLIFIGFAIGKEVYDSADNDPVSDEQVAKVYEKPDESKTLVSRYEQKLQETCKELKCVPIGCDEDGDCAVRFLRDNDRCPKGAYDYDYWNDRGILHKFHCGNLGCGQK